MVLNLFDLLLSIWRIFSTGPDEADLVGQQKLVIERKIQLFCK